jgi:pimeloyl-ACP methyl ester carboxylesterase
MSSHVDSCPQKDEPFPAYLTSLTTAYMDYLVDAGQRTILFLDALRQRGNIHFKQSEKTAPNVLRFDYELVLDGRTFERPVNYLLVRIRAPDDMPLHPRKRPFIVFDPRAGHGPGIGGMKKDSEIGAVLQAGHPCYFVGFLPAPIPGQTIEDVCRAQAAFIAAVIERHPDADGKPCLIGNCQAGWQVALTSAIRPDLVGPLILAGAPLSYWAGVHGKAPMRYTGGLLGGSWQASLASDLGNGIFDGAALVQNFENLNPANTVWSKNYNLYAKVDTEASRFLDFETCWGSPVLLNGEEIQFIVDELFIGNKLTAGEILTSDGVRVDLRNIRTPIVVFCSHGDDITPPQQALGWILDLYDSEDEIVAAGQTILYSLHPSIGHLGIFVSGSVANKQHEEFAQNIDLIDALPPGLFEATFAPKDGSSAHPELLPTDYAMTIHPRSLADIRALGGNSPEDDLRFATVARLSEINQGLYRTLLQPAVRAVSNEQSAGWLRGLNTHRLCFEIFSDRNPWMAPLASAAESVKANRRAVTSDNPFSVIQANMSEQIKTALDLFRDTRDHWLEECFLRTYGSPLLQAAVGLQSKHSEAHRRIGRDVERETAVTEQIARLRQSFAEGGGAEAVSRALIYLLRAAPGIDERSFALLRYLRRQHPVTAGITLKEFKSLLRSQLLLVHLDEKAAVAAIPGLVTGSGLDSTALLEALWRIISAGGEPSPEVGERYHRLESLLGQVEKKAVGRQRQRPVE